ADSRRLAVTAASISTGIMRVYVTKHRDPHGAPRAAHPAPRTPGPVDLHFANAVPADAQQLAARGRAGRGISHYPAAAAQSPGAARVVHGVALVCDARRVLRHPSGGPLLCADAAARVLRRRDVFAGLDQRAAAGVVVVSSGG